MFSRGEGEPAITLVETPTTLLSLIFFQSFHEAGQFTNAKTETKIPLPTVKGQFTQGEWKVKRKTNSFTKQPGMQLTFTQGLKARPSFPSFVVLPIFVTLDHPRYPRNTSKQAGNAPSRRSPYGSKYS